MRCRFWAGLEHALRPDAHASPVADDRRLRILAIPFWLLRAAFGLVWRLALEVADVGFTWTRPYIVDGGKFTHRFGFVPMPFKTGVPATILAFAGDR